MSKFRITWTTKLAHTAGCCFMQAQITPLLMVASMQVCGCRPCSTASLYALSQGVLAIVRAAAAGAHIAPSVMHSAQDAIAAIYVLLQQHGSFMAQAGSAGKAAICAAAEAMTASLQASMDRGFRVEGSELLYPKSCINCIIIGETDVHCCCYCCESVRKLTCSAPLCRFWHEQPVFCQQGGVIAPETPRTGHSGIDRTHC